MPLRQWKIRIQHIIERIEFVQEFTKDRTFDEFQRDRRTSFAVITCLSVIGEAAKLVPSAVRQSYPGIPWNKLRRMRNILVHEYDRIPMDVIWKTTQQDLPPLLPELRRILLQAEALDNSQD
ncbi:MAG: DUF86 domain-containing protein [Candidatus Hydrogenedentes bacterium]|nr:DUF86 domain-containing protein [Candidatus Hydrogenedentota bacterium]